MKVKANYSLFYKVSIWLLKFSKCLSLFLQTSNWLDTRDCKRLRFNRRFHWKIPKWKPRFLETHRLTKILHCKKYWLTELTLYLNLRNQHMKLQNKIHYQWPRSGLKGLKLLWISNGHRLHLRVTLILITNLRARRSIRPCLPPKRLCSEPLPVFIKSQISLPRVSQNNGLFPASALKENNINNLT
jgi:hypothetical protein